MFEVLTREPKATLLTHLYHYERTSFPNHRGDSGKCHKLDEQLVHMLSSADVARRLMLIAKRDKWQFVVKT
jgi:hypothetical protein